MSTSINREASGVKTPLLSRGVSDFSIRFPSSTAQPLWDQPRDERIRRILAFEEFVQNVQPVPCSGCSALVAVGHADHLCDGLEVLIKKREAWGPIKRTSFLKAALDRYDVSEKEQAGSVAPASDTSTAYGNQLLPSQNSQFVHPLAPWVLFMYATLGLFRLTWLATLLGLLPAVRRVRERNIIVSNGSANTPPHIGTILCSAPSSDLTYNASQELLGILRVRAYIAIVFAWCVNFAAWGSIIGTTFLPPSEILVVSRSSLAWAIDWVSSTTSAMTTQRPPYMGYALLLAAATLIAVVMFVLATLDKAPLTLPYVGTGDGDLPAVLPLIVETQGTPFSMVSYSWMPQPNATLPRALAAALPNCWVDIHMLASGSVVSSVTSKVARECFFLVIFLSPHYFRSKNCCVEFAEALLARRAHQVTWAYAAPDAHIGAGVEAQLEELGVRVFRDLTALTDEADKHVYRCNDARDAERVLTWYGEHAQPRSNVPRHYRLPPPKIMVDFHRSFACTGRLWRPRGSLHVGPIYISPDGLATGTSVVVVLEQVLIAFALATTAAHFWVLARGYSLNSLIDGQPPQNHSIYFWFAMPAVLYSLLWVTVLVFFPFALSLDVRAHHSETLLPLCVAAFVNSQSSKVRGKRSTLSVVFAVSDADVTKWTCAMDGLVAGEERLDERLNNVATFVRSMGVEASFEHFRDGAANSFAGVTTNLCVAVFVLRSVDAAVLWLCDHAAHFPLSNTILLVCPAITADIHACTRCRVSVENAYHECGGGAARSRPNPAVLRLRDYIFLDVRLLLRGPGPDGCGAYDGFAPALLDNLGAKFGAAFLTALRRKAGSGAASSPGRE